jgi:hypothetical protein
MGEMRKEYRLQSEKQKEKGRLEEQNVEGRVPLVGVASTL